MRFLYGTINRHGWECSRGNELAYHIGYIVREILCASASPVENRGGILRDIRYFDTFDSAYFTALTSSHLTSQ